MTEPAVIRIALAGALSVDRAGRRATERDLPGRQPRLAFTALVRSRGRPVANDVLAEVVWPGDLPATWQPALRGLASRVRHMFDLVGLDGSQVLSADAGAYLLDLPVDATVDVEQAAMWVDEAAEVLDAGGEAAARRLASEARAILSRPLLPGIDNPWLDGVRSELDTVLVRCLELLGRCRLLAGEYTPAVQVVEELLRREPYREPAWRLLMRVHAEAGSTAEALRAYERCRTLLADELGVDPSAESHELYVQLLRRTVPEPVGASDPVSLRHINLVGPPYRGLRHFEEEHAPVFFGRDVEIDALVGRLRTQRLVTVVGPSGCGKSSLVRAGLLPALRAGALPDSDTWPRTTMVPGADPYAALRTALSDLRRDPAVHAASDELQRGEGSLHDAVLTVLEGEPQTTQLILVVDQFEELFTMCRDAEVRDRFITDLRASSRRNDARLYVIVTLRADLYGHAAALPDLADTLASSQVVVPTLDGEGLQQAIEGPARVAGLRLEDGLVGRILADVTGAPGMLPLLQHALLELYERRADHVLTRGAYADIGGVEGAVARHAEETWTRLGPDRQATARRILLRLVQPGDGIADSRRRAHLHELVAGPADQNVTEPVLRQLVDARLLVAATEGAAADATLEIAHEALLTAWPRLAGWIDAERQSLRVHRRLSAQADEWENHDRDPGFLLSGGRLAEVRAWVDEHGDEANIRERAFVRASIRHADEGQRRRARRRRWLTAALTVALVIIGSLAVVAARERSRADREADIARSRQIAAEVAGQLDVDPELALLLALEAHRIAPTAEAATALRQAFVRSPLVHRLRTEGLDPHVAVDSDGRWLATYELGGGLVVFDAATGDRIAELTVGGSARLPGVAGAVAFSPDGDRLVATNLDGGAWIWSVPDGRLITSLPWDPIGEVVYVAVEDGVGWSRDGTRVVVAGLDGSARVFDAEAGTLIASFPGPGSAGAHLARARLSPSGDVLAVEGTGGAVGLFDVERAQPMLTLEGHAAALRALRFTPDGRLLVTASDDGTAGVWDVSTGAVVHQLTHGTPLRDLAIDPEGERVLTGDVVGIARIWDLATGMLVMELDGHQDRITAVRYDPTGDLALTASLDGTARVWETTTGEELTALVGSSQPVVDAEFSPSGDAVLTGGDDARLWRVTGLPQRTIHVHDAPVYDLAFSRDGDVMVTGGLADGAARAWSVPEAAELSSTFHPTGTIAYVDVTADGTLALTSPSYSSPGASTTPEPARVWDTRTGEVLLELPTPHDDPFGICGGRCAVTQSAFAPDGRRIAVAGYDGRVRVVSADDGSTVMVTSPGKDPAMMVAWRPDGRAVLVEFASPERAELVLLDADTGERIAALPALPQALTAGQVAFSPDGRLIGASLGSVVQMFDAGEGVVVAELPHRGAVRDLDVHRDAELVVTAAASGVAIWDIASQRPIVHLPGTHGAFTAAFTPDGTAVVIGAADGTVRFHDCSVCRPVDEIVAVARQRVTRQLSPQERRRFDLSG